MHQSTKCQQNRAMRVAELWMIQQTFSARFYSASALLAMQTAVIAKAILSVRPSVTFRCFVQTNEDTFVRFLPGCMECGGGLAMRIVSVCPFVCPSVCLSVCLSVRPYVRLSVKRVIRDKMERRKIGPDFLHHMKDHVA